MRQREAKPIEAANAAAASAVVEGFRPHYAEGYLFALLCAVCYGMTPVLVRSAIGSGGPGQALAAAQDHALVFGQFHRHSAEHVRTRRAHGRHGGVGDQNTALDALGAQGHPQERV